MRTAVDYENGCIRLLDQRRLPLETSELAITTVEELCQAIRTLAVRGAPAIGLAGAYGVALAAHEAQGDDTAFRALTEQIASARPTAVNLRVAVEGAVTAACRTGERERGALGFAEELRLSGMQAEEAIAIHGAGLIVSDARILTHCHTGAIATGATGTALGAILEAARRRKVQKVWVDETRPLFQGTRLTAWELGQHGVPYAVLPDSAAAALMASGEVDAVLVGADRICRNGDTANKVGTYGLAVAARHHRIPFYVLAPETTLDRTVATGAGIPIEQRAEEELLSVAGQRIAPPGARAWNPAFDVTPGNLIDAIVTERGVYWPPYGFKED